MKQCILMLALLALMSIAGANAARSLQQGRGPPLDVLELPPQAAAAALSADSRSFTPGSAKKVSSVGN
jgi:hypothetical protein